MLSVFFIGHKNLTSSTALVFNKKVELTLFTKLYLETLLTDTMNQFNIFSIVSLIIFHILIDKYIIKFF